MHEDKMILGSSQVCLPIMFPFLSGHGVSDICGECWVCGPYLNVFFFPS